MSPPNEHDRTRSLRQWLAVARAHDLGLCKHSILVGTLAANFGAYLGLSDERRDLITIGAFLHDIGKIKIPVELLRNPAGLSAREWAQIRLHSELGYEILKAEGSHDIEVLAIVRNHHERLDGSGYPRGMHGAEISEGTRIVTLCDIYAAITETRPYAGPMRWQDALERMAQKQTRIDTALLNRFADMMSLLQQAGSEHYSLALRVGRKRWKEMTWDNTRR